MAEDPKMADIKETAAKPGQKRYWWRIRKSAQFMFGRCLKTRFVSRLAPHENEFATSIRRLFTLVGNKAGSFANRLNR
jgi:hypothetical protein